MSWYEELDQKMADYLPDVPVLREEPLSRHTSFRIGGPALTKRSARWDWSAWAAWMTA